MKPIHVGLLVGALVVGVWWWRGRSSKGVAVYVPNETKEHNKSVILALFASAGYHGNVAKAAIVNAMAESALNHEAVGDGGHSVGLFQINDLRGKRVFTGDRKDAAYNTRWILDNEQAALAKVQAAALAGADVPALAAMFSQLVERPADAQGEATRRAALARKMFPPSEVS